jgi:hypothetical protein
VRGVDERADELCARRIDRGHVGDVEPDLLRAALDGVQNASIADRAGGPSSRPASPVH